MVNCVQCGSPSPENQKFCGQCGSVLVAVCPACSNENPPGHRFCGQCGTTLGGKPQTDAPLAIERRVVSVLFIDLVGFTPFSENRDPEEVRALITEYFELAGETIGRFGGTVDKFIGDAVMAWWGATTAHEDDAERAVRAALDVVDTVVALGERAGVPDLAARAAVMTGEASVGPGGNEKGLLLGDLVNSTSRLQAVADPGTVFVGDATASRIKEAVELVPAGSFEVKGKAHPITAWRAVRVLAERGGRGRADVVEPPFVGRDSELRLLKDLLHATGKERRARLVSLVGEAGIGKSRLASELKKYADGLVEPVFWHEGRSPAYGDAVNLWALGEMIRQRAGLQETDDDSTTRERLIETTEGLVSDPSSRSWVRERLESLLGIGDSIGGDQAELFSAARAFFEAISSQGTVVLVFEDLHWADPNLLEFVEELTDWSHNFPILVLTLARPDLLERRPDWGSGRRGFTSLRLGPLTDEDMTEMISQMVAGASNEAIARIVAKAAGVPLFAVEIVRMLQSEGVGAGLAEATESIEVPGSIQAVISARLDRLEPQERDLVRDAAVLGHTFGMDGLAALRDEPVDKFEHRLSGLVRKEVLELVRDPRSPERGQYRWLQSLLKEVAYSRLAKADRHRRHLSAARYYRDLEDPELAQVAMSHFISALETGEHEPHELQSEMVEAVRRALDRARSLHAHDQVISMVDLALPAVDDDAKPELWEWGAKAATRNSDLTKAEAYTQAFMEYARPLGPPIIHRAYALAGLTAVEFRRFDQAVALLEPHLQEHDDFTVDSGLAMAAVHYSRALMLLGRSAQAAAAADSALEAVEGFALNEGTADAMITRGAALSTTRPNQGLALLKGALALARKHQISHTALRAQINIGATTPDFKEGHEYTRAAFEEAKRIGDRQKARFVAGNLVGGARLDLEFDEKILADPILFGSGPDGVELLLREAWLRALRGDLVRAEGLIAESEEMSSGETDIRLRLAIEHARSSLALVNGDAEMPYETDMRHLRDHPFFEPSSHLWSAAIGASLLGDRKKLEAVREARESLTLVLTGLGLAASQQINIMFDLMDGDLDHALSQAEELGTWLWEQELCLPELLLRTAVARQLPTDHPQRATHSARAREIAEAAGADSLLRMIDHFLS